MSSPDFPHRVCSPPVRRAFAALLPVVALVTGALVPSAGAVDDPAPAPPPTEPAPATEPAPVIQPTSAAASSVSTTAIASWGTARKDGTSKAQKVTAIVEANGVAYLGGEFTKMVRGGSRAYRNYLAAINSKTGDLKSWNPKANKKVFALELSADGRSVYVGGDITSIGGKWVSKLAKIDLATGALDRTFRPAVKGRVLGLALHGDRLYVGGNFLSVGGQPRPKLAAVDPITGAVLPWTPPPLGSGRYLGQTGIPTPDYAPGHVFAVEAIGGKVFAAGNFTNLGGQGGLVTIDAATGGLAEPQYDPGRPIFDLDTYGGILYAAGGGPGGRLYAFSLDKQSPLWKVKVDGDAMGVAASASTVYLAGHYDYIVSKDSSCYQFCPGGPRRHHLAAFTAAGGQLLPWNPDADTSTGPYTATVGAEALYVGGEFRNINFKPQPGFAIFPGTP